MLLPEGPLSIHKKTLACLAFFFPNDPDEERFNRLVTEAEDCFSILTHAAGIKIDRVYMDTQRNFLRCGYDVVLRGVIE